MKKYIFILLIICLSAKDELTDMSDTKIFSFFVQRIARYSKKDVNGGDYVSLVISSYKDKAKIKAYVSFSSTSNLTEFKYQHRSYDTDDMVDFVTSFFWDSSSKVFTKNGTQYNFTLTWTRTSKFNYLLLIPQKIDGNNEMTIQLDYLKETPLYKTIILIVVLVVLGLLAIILIIFCIYKYKCS